MRDSSVGETLFSGLFQTTGIYTTGSQQLIHDQALRPLAFWDLHSLAV